MEPCAIVPLPPAVDLAAILAPAAGEAPLVRVVRALLGVVAEARIVVTAGADSVAAAQSCLREAGLAAVGVAAGDGESRPRLLAAGLDHLDVERISSTAVLVGDVRHVLSPRRVAQRVIAGLETGREVVVPTLPVTDTVKTVDASGSVLGTVDRSTLRTVQYPRGFIASALWKLVSGPPVMATEDLDEFGLAMRAGLNVDTVDGDADGFAVELPRDRHLLEAIIASRPG
jgi:2-C-methyl-D-erythritol 4-phosphate cytidylyltransferase